MQAKDIPKPPNIWLFEVFDPQETLNALDSINGVYGTLDLLEYEVVVLGLRTGLKNPFGKKGFGVTSSNCLERITHYLGLAKAPAT